MLDIVLRDIESGLTADLSKGGFIYHIFSRIKSVESTKLKIENKAKEYKEKGKRMQDLLGLRVTLYFSDDVEILHQYLKAKPNFLDETIDKDDEKTFCPKRLNIIMKVPEDWRNEMQLYLKQLYSDSVDMIDLTYEIQIRTILSEGWHEVEHDFRYKCKEDWAGFTEEARLLNGIFATLENCEWSMLTLFDRMAYSFYNSHNWTNMIRNKMRIRFADKSISEGISTLLNEKQLLAKNLFRTPRSKVIRAMMEKDFIFPLKYDTVVHLMNRLEVKDLMLANLENKILSERLDKLLGKI